MKFIGPQIFARGPSGKLLTRIGTVFLRTPGLVTTVGVHAMQRLIWVDTLNADREKDGLPPLTDDEIDAEMAESVDLLFDENYVLIRPDPGDMALAFRGDEMLQQIVSKRRIRYLNIQNWAVRDALRMRGEAWRMSPMPLEEEEIRHLIENAHAAIHGLPLYFYNRLTGTRFLTLDNFRRLGQQPVAVVRQHLQEIKTNAQGRNRFANPEIDFFPPKCGMNEKDFTAYDFESMDDRTLMAVYEQLLAKFDSVVPLTLKTDDMENVDWRKAMTSVLLPSTPDVGVMTVLEGLSPEFFMQVEWLPGGCIEEGELVFDPIFDEADQHPEDIELQYLCDRRAKAILLNYLREYSKIEYANIGRTRHSLSHRKGQGPRAHVYIVELKEVTSDQPFVRIIRFQRWTICTHLDNHKPLLDAILESEDYTDYVMDRRLGCRQLGMNLPNKMMPRRLREHYRSDKYSDFYAWTTYFERDYIMGRATDKIPAASYSTENFNIRLARLLGGAAACNLILGRANLEGRTIFDDGDEVIRFDGFGLPEELVVSEPTGAFANYRRPYLEDVSVYADAMNKRKKFMRNFNQAAEVYLMAFEDRLLRVQRDYHARRRAFHALFSDRPYSDKGSMAYRWERILERLDHANVKEVTAAIRARIDFDEEIYV